MHCEWILRWAVTMVLVHVSLALAIVSGSAPEHLERGHRRLIQTRLETADVARERLAEEAVAAFKEAYQNAGPSTQVHALLGAAQAYLLMQSPRRVFPFLWQATPLQRAEKSLQQALFLHPDNAAAALLLGVVHWRQAATASGQQADTLARSRRYLEQAATLGVPVRLPAASAQARDPSHRFGADDSILILQYVDAQGHGKLDNLLLIYQPVDRPCVFGMVIAVGRAQPLTTDTATGALAPASLLEAMTVTPQPGSAPILALRFRQGAQHFDTRFVWNGTRFAPLPVLPP